MEKYVLNRGIHVGSLKKDLPEGTVFEIEEDYVTMNGEKYKKDVFVEYKILMRSDFSSPFSEKVKTSKKKEPKIEPKVEEKVEDKNTLKMVESDFDKHPVEKIEIQQEERKEDKQPDFDNMKTVEQDEDMLTHDITFITKDSNKSENSIDVTNIKEDDNFIKEGVIEEKGPEKESIKIDVEGFNEKPKEINNEKIMDEKNHGQEVVTSIDLPDDISVGKKRGRKTKI